MGFLYGRCKHLFVGELNNCLFLQTFILKQCLCGYVLHNSLLHLLLKNDDFFNTDISQLSVATRLGCGGGIYISLCYKFPSESNSGRILKIGKYLVKLWARVRCLVFLTYSVYVITLYDFNLGTFKTIDIV